MMGIPRNEAPPTFVDCNFKSQKALLLLIHYCEKSGTDLCWLSLSIRKDLFDFLKAVDGWKDQNIVSTAPTIVLCLYVCLLIDPNISKVFSKLIL